MESVDAALARMRKAGKLFNYKEKGSAGEDAIIIKCKEVKQRHGGLLYESFAYPYQSNRDGKNYTGNIKLQEGSYIEVTDGSFEDEIDVLYITHHRVFAIEVKSYHAKMKIADNWLYKNGQPVEKSPIAQAEKHARHLYHAISCVLPEGNPNYIVPICVFVDRCTVEDTRPANEKFYLPVCILNNFKKTLLESNIPLQYDLDLDAIQKRLKEVATSIRTDFN